MARNQEKAMSTLNRWVDQRRMIETATPARFRSSLPSECRSVKECEAARASILRQLTSQISQIQNASLGETRLRELNDDINRLLRSKYAWESQILKLGGPDYRVIGARLVEADATEIPGQSGYKYFGAAKDLPGVRELVEASAAGDDAPRKSRQDILKNIDSLYYGWYDEDHPELLRAERAAEITNGCGDFPIPYHNGDLDPDLSLAQEVDPMQIDKILLTRKKQALIKTLGSFS
jgi:pre-mRNA-splicing factor ISY1